MFAIFEKVFVTRKEMEELNLRTAEEVRAEFKRRSDRNKIIAAIEAAAKQNRTQVTVDGWLNEEIIAELKQKGYEIIEFEHIYDKKTAILW